MNAIDAHFGVHVEFSIWSTRNIYFFANWHNLRLNTNYKLNVTKFINELAVTVYSDNILLQLDISGLNMGMYSGCKCHSRIFIITSSIDVSDLLTSHNNVLIIHNRYVIELLQLQLS